MKRITHILGLITIVFSMNSCGSEEVTSETIRPVRYAEVLKVSNGEERTFSGIAQSSQEINLSFKVGGKITSLKVQTGDRVSKGQLIATLEQIDYEVQLKQAKSQEESALAQEKSAATQIKSAEANLIATRSAYKRIQKLYETNSVSLSEYEQVKASYNAAQAQYDAAVLQHEAAQTQVSTAGLQSEAAKNQVDYTKLYAPFAGVITKLNIETNEMVGSGTVIGMLSTTAQPEVSVGIPEAFIAKIKNGDKALVTFSAIPAQNFKGIVDEVGYSPSSGSTYPIVLRIENPSATIRPGMAAGVSFVFEDEKTDKKSEEVLLVPARAIKETGGQTFAYVLKPSKNDNYTTPQKKVTVGKLVKQGFIIKEGLQENDIVATAGLKFLSEGMTVKLLKE